MNADTDLPVPGEGSHSSQIRLTSEEINTLVYLYLQESNFPHAAFALLTESALPSTMAFQKFNPSYPCPYPPSIRSLSSSASSRTNGSAKPPTAAEEFGSENGKIPRGELVRKMWKALRWEEIEQHASRDNSVSSCSSPFHLLIPHKCDKLGESSASEPMAARSAPVEAMTARPSQIPPNSVSESDASKVEPEDGPFALPTIPHSSSPARLKRKGSLDPVTVMPTVVPQLADTTDTRSGASIVERDRSPNSASSGTQRAQHRIRPQVKKPRLDDKKEDTKEDTKADLKDDAKKDEEQVNVPPENTDILIANLSLPSNEGGTWSEHRDSVTCLSWNPKDKEVLASSSNDGTAKLWHFMEPVDSDNLALRLVKKPSSISHKSIDSGKKAVTALVWHPDGTVFATASDGVGRLFTPSGQLQGILTYGRGAINSLKFNPSGTSLLAAKDDFTICLFVLDFDLKSPKQLSFEAHSKEVNDVDWLDDDIFASGGNDHTVFIYRANDRRPRFTLKGHTDDVTRVKWSPRQQGVPDHNRLLASVADDGSIMIWKLPHYPADRGTASRSLSPSKLAREKEPSVDDFLQVTVAPGSEYCRNRLQVVSGETDNKRMNTLEWSPDSHQGHMIVAAGGQDSTVKLFNAETGECLHTLSGLEAGTGSIAFSPITSSARPFGILAGGGWNGKLCFWDVKTGQLLKEYEVEEDPERQNSRDRPMMLAMSWRHDGQHLAAGLHNKSLMAISTSKIM